MSKSNFIPRPRVAKYTTLNQLALMATRCSIEEFNHAYEIHIASGRDYPDHITNGLDAFVYDLTIREKLLDNIVTPKQLSATIYHYGMHWFN